MVSYLRQLYIAQNGKKANKVHVCVVSWKTGDYLKKHIIQTERIITGNLLNVKKLLQSKLYE